MKKIAFIIFGLLLVFNVKAEVPAQPSTDPTIGCIDQLRVDTRFQSLFEKMPIDITKGQPLEVLASKSKVSTKEKNALSLFTAEGEKCFALGSEWRQKNYLPSVVNLLDKYRVDVLSVLADLYSGNSTFGATAKTRAKLLAEFNSNLSGIIRDTQALREAAEKQRLESEAKEREAKVARDLNIQLQNEKDQRQEQYTREQEQFANEQAERQQLENRRNALLPYLMKPYQPYQLPAYQMPIQRQQNTNCTVNGNQMNCTTR